MKRQIKKLRKRVASMEETVKRLTERTIGNESTAFRESLAFNKARQELQIINQKLEQMRHSQYNDRVLANRAISAVLEFRSDLVALGKNKIELYKFKTNEYNED